MKKIICLCSIAILFTMVSCTDETAEVKKEKEVIVVPVEKKQAPAPAPKEEKPTSITVGKEGVEVESKKVNVKVNP
ncbi:MAG TPA: hypothetical protein PLZ68_16010 [Ferruginibacter sp.]|nr:hypothetical protein [Ferruginibacter sp.]